MSMLANVRGSRGALHSMVAMVLAGVAACSDAAEPEPYRAYRIEVSGESFTVRVTDAQAIARMDARLQSGQTGVISGRLVAGNGGFNSPWSWHLDPESVHVPDLTIELCDGRPSMVEADLAYWIENVEFFCPWGARVVSAGG